jgi:arginine N-succinyltransferase
MKIIRPIQHQDLDQFEKIAQSTGIGMTSIPKNRKCLAELIDHSMASFAKEAAHPVHETYLFVLEDLETGELGGICGIYSKTGVKEPVYFYRVEKRAGPKSGLPVPKYFTLLMPASQTNGPSELCSLYLMPHFRKGGLGKLLSFSRLLFIASFPNRFDHKIYAEIRGFIDDKNESPFWNGLGKRFLNLTFKELNKLLDGRRNFFPEGLPELPLYTLLLSKETQRIIGKCHIHSEGALEMLTEEGFVITDKINPIDGGPVIEAKTATLHTVSESHTAVIKQINTTLPDGQPALIAIPSLDYRCAMGKVELFSDDQIAIETSAAKVLKVEVGQTVRYIVKGLAL